MSETRSPDPLRRSPPVIDLDAKVVSGPDGKPPASAKPGPGEPAEPATAIEPVATTGLGSDPFPKSATATDPKSTGPAPAGPTPGGAGPTASQPAGGKSADNKSADNKSADSKSPDGKPGAPKPGDAKPSDSKSAGVASTTSAAAPKPGDTKPADGVSSSSASPARPGDTKPTDGKSAGATSTAPATAAKPGDTKPGDMKPASAAPSSATATKPATGPAATTDPDKTKTSEATAPKVAPSGTTPKVVASTADESGKMPGPRSRSVLPAALVSGIVGAALAAIAVYWLLHATDLALGERLANLERRVAALPTGNPTAALETRLAAAEAAARQAGEDAKAARQVAEGAARQAGERPGGPGPDAASKAALDALSARVEDSVRQTGANTAGLADLGGKVEALSTRMAEGLAAATTAANAVGSSVRGLGTDVATLRSSAASAETRLATSEKTLAALKSTVETTTADLAKLQPAASQAGLRIAVSGRLDEALRSGAPLGPATGALERLGVEASLLAPLRPYATAAAPSSGQLAAEFRPIAATLTTPARPTTESWLDLVKRLLGKVVSVRAVGDGSGEDVPGLVARIEAALGRGAVGEAAAAWDRLPAPAKQASAAWAERLKGRAAADDAARRIGNLSLAGLEAVTR